MAQYQCGASVLRLTGHVAAVRPDQMFEHDFSADGPEGEHGPAREAALVESGAMRPIADREPAIEPAQTDSADAASSPEPTSTTERPRRGPRRKAETEQE